MGQLASSEVLMSPAAVGGERVWSHSIAQCFEERTEHRRALQGYKNAVTGLRRGGIGALRQPHVFCCC